MTLLNICPRRELQNSFEWHFTCDVLAFKWSGLIRLELFLYAITSRKKTVVVRDQPFVENRPDKFVDGALQRGSPVYSEGNQ